MQTLYDFGMEVQKIREAADNLTVKGSENATRVVYIVQKCNGIIQAINEILESQQNPPEGGQNGEDKLEVRLVTDETPIMEEDDANGESDSGTA